MTALRVPALRYTLGRNGPILRSSQRRWAQVHDVRFVATHREPDRVLEKYREKLDRKAKEHGLRDAHELKEAYRAKIQDLRRKASLPSTSQSPAASTTQSPAASTTQSPPPPSTNSPFPPPPPAPQPLATPSPTNAPSTTPSKPPPGIKPLSSYLSIPKTLTLPPTEISQIWRLRHASSPTSLCATIPSATYARIERTARRHPQFILPLPREGQGAEIHFLQWTFPSPTTATVLFTHLAEYKLRGEYATPHTTVTHHLDFAAEKGLVLMEGSVVTGRGVSVDEGKWLVMCLQKFYAEGGGNADGDGAVEGGRKGETRGGESGVRKKLLEQFSQGDGGFRIEELLEEAEKI